MRLFHGLLLFACACGKSSSSPPPQPEGHTVGNGGGIVEDYFEEMKLLDLYQQGVFEEGDGAYLRLLLWDPELRPTLDLNPESQLSFFESRELFLQRLRQEIPSFGERMLAKALEQNLQGRYYGTSYSLHRWTADTLEEILLEVAPEEKDAREIARASARMANCAFLRAFQFDVRELPCRVALF